MSASDERGFLSRWSRRKVAAREGRPLEEPLPPTTAPDEIAAVPGEIAPSAETRPSEPPVDLPAVESLEGLASDYRDFMRANVDPALKRAALRRLFADPHFNVMDGLDVYIDDYSIPDPIPEAMMATLEHAKPLFRALLEDRDGAMREGRDDAVVASLAPSNAAEPSATTARTECPDVPTMSRSEPIDASEQRRPREQE